MYAVIEKTFGGLAPSYYFRQLLFGSAITASFVWFLSEQPDPTPTSVIVWLVLTTLLYPYSRFVYEGIVGFLMGNTVVMVEIALALAVKVTAMLLCWIFAVVIAPIGLIYLYYYHSKNSARTA